MWIDVVSDSNTTRERTRANVFGACSHVLEFVQETYLCDRGSWPHLLCRFVSFEAAEVVSQTAESVVDSGGCCSKIDRI